MKTSRNIIAIIGITLAGVAQAQNTNAANNPSATTTPTTGAGITSNSDTGMVDNTGTAFPPSNTTTVPSGPSGVGSNTRLDSNQADSVYPTPPQVARPNFNQGTPNANVTENTAPAETTRVNPNSAVANRQTIMGAQRALNSQGFSVTTDGFMGPSTRDAITRFQARNGIQQSGNLDVPTLRALNVEGFSSTGGTTLTPSTGTTE